jgi:hypothetical protein
MASSKLGLETDSYDDLEAEYDIVEHEQAHAVTMARTNTSSTSTEQRQSLLGEAELDEDRWGQQQQTSPAPTGSMIEPFLDKFAGMMSRDNMESILKEQSHMLVGRKIVNNYTGLVFGLLTPHQGSWVSVCQCSHS